MELDVNRTVRSVMALRGYSIRQLSFALGEHRSLVSMRFSRAGRPTPTPWTVEQLERLAVVLKVPIGLFLLPPEELELY